MMMGKEKILWERTEGPDELAAVGDRHHVIGDDEIGLLAERPLESVAPVRSRDDAVSGQLEELAHELPEGVFVVDYEDRLHGINAAVVSWPASPL
jgi:hypothetical protein